MQLPAKSKQQFDVRPSTFDVGFLQTGNPALAQHLRETIRAHGPITFASFMEQALYHPADGYYSSGRCTIGRSGDYYTSVSVGPLFGRLLTAQFAEMWAALGRPNDFTIVEQGAHDGVFARDVLDAAQRHHPDLAESLRYEIVEPFPILQARQAETLAPHCEKVAWHQSLAALPRFRGVHFSNELLDAMPVHVALWTGSEWLERHVTENADDFVFIDLPLADEALGERLRALPLRWPAGYEVEVNLAALDWIVAVSQKLTTGFILAVDYGYPRDQLYAPHRACGTLRSYAKHRVLASPLIEIGHADITAHVEWTSLGERAEAVGWRTLGFTEQQHFVTGLITGTLAAEFGPSSDAKMRRALQTLLHPDFLGRDFQFLGLSKGLVAPLALAGFRLAREPRAALGLRA